MYVLGVPATPKIFLEVMNYTLVSYDGDFINSEDDDIFLYNKSLSVTSKFNKRNSFPFKRVEKRLAGWQKRYLLKGGKEVLIKSTSLAFLHISRHFCRTQEK